MNDYWDSDYPTHIIIPEDYWTYSCTIVEDSSDETKEK